MKERLQLLTNSKASAQNISVWRKFKGGLSFATIPLLLFMYCVLTVSPAYASPGDVTPKTVDANSPAGNGKLANASTDNSVSFDGTWPGDNYTASSYGLVPDGTVLDYDNLNGAAFIYLGDDNVHGTGSNKYFYLDMTSTSEPVTPGQYRFVVFVEADGVQGEEIFYSANLIEVVEGEEFQSKTLTTSITGLTINGDFTSGATANAESIEVGSVTCTEFAEAGAKMIALYNITATGSYQGNITVTIPVSTDHNGKEVNILHCNGSTTETVSATVTNGAVSGDFTSLSPFGVVLKSTATEYNVWCNGERFTSEKLTITCGEGTAVYEPSTSTLTLNNATISNGCVIPDDLAFTYCNSGIFTLENLNVLLMGNNNIEDTGGTGIDSYGSSSNVNISISGSGSLSITETAPYDGYGIYCTGNLSIDGVTMHINSSCTGLWAESSTTISNSKIVIMNSQDNYYGMVVNNGGATIDGSIIISNKQPLTGNSSGCFYLLDGNSVYVLSNNSMVLTYNKTITTVEEGDNDGIISDPAGVAVWDIVGGKMGIAYENGGINGFEEISGVTINPGSGTDPDLEAVNAAKGLIEAADFTVEQATANTEEEVKTWLAGQINAIEDFNKTGITVTKDDITLTDFEEAIEGDSGSPSGTNGSFEFTVSLTSGASNATTDLCQGTITATQLTYHQQTLTTNVAELTLSGLFTTGATATATTMSPGNVVCTEFADALAAAKLLLVYDISVTGSYQGKIIVTIPVDIEHNGKEADILHCNGSTTETVATTVTGGTVSGEFTSLSPFGVVLKSSVNEAVTGVTMSSASLSLKVGQTGNLSANVAPTTATDKSVTWSSNNDNIATVSTSGMVTAIAAGTTSITATTTDGGFTATCTVSVTTPAPAIVHVTGVTVSPTTLSLEVGQTERVEAIVEPATATDNNVSWSSSNEAIATVSASGIVSAVAEGTASITATTLDGRISATCAVTILKSTVGNESLNDNTFVVYPNPTDGQITIEGLAPGGAVRLYSIFGNLINTFTTNDGVLIIDISNLKQGMYFINYEGKTLKVIRK